MMGARCAAHSFYSGRAGCKEAKTNTVARNFFPMHSTHKYLPALPLYVFITYTHIFAQSPYIHICMYIVQV